MRYVKVTTKIILFKAHRDSLPVLFVDVTSIIGIILGKNDAHGAETH